ncbi:hypothetical protein [Mitsuokella jalaludinii]|uniref:hypothetical protein n=1 Tax=Mitsuokella jalaludinii TaxID=187979 RepID=UPI0022E0D4BF|nr:hypothetical protein [Mitsuokella jalaludinii]
MDTFDERTHRSTHADYTDYNDYSGDDDCNHTDGNGDLLLNYPDPLAHFQEYRPAPFDFVKR